VRTSNGGQVGWRVDGPDKGLHSNNKRSDSGSITVFVNILNATIVVQMRLESLGW
jgi:hypothetical protein